MDWELLSVYVIIYGGQEVQEIYPWYFWFCPDIFFVDFVSQIFDFVLDIFDFILEIFDFHSGILANKSAQK